MDGVCRPSVERCHGSRAAKRLQKLCSCQGIAQSEDDVFDAFLPTKGGIVRDKGIPPGTKKTDVGAPLGVDARRG